MEKSTKKKIVIGAALLAAIVAFVAFGQKSMSGKIFTTKPNQLPADFSEQGYLALNPDVANAVAQGGGLKSASDHFFSYGWSEGRRWK